MTIHFRYEYADFDRARWGRGWPRKPPARGAVAAAVLAVSGVAMAVGGGTYLAVTGAPGWWAVAVFPLLVVGAFLARVFAVIRNGAGSPADWAVNPLSRAEVAIELTEAGINLVAPHWRQTAAWGAVTDVYENASQIRIAFAHEAQLIPKRVFVDLREIAEFKALLRARVGKEFVRPRGYEGT